MHSKPVLFNIPTVVESCNPLVNRSHPWFTEDLILAYGLGHWLDTYIAQNLLSIQLLAGKHRMRFYYHPRDKEKALLTQEFFGKPDEVYMQYIHDHFFKDGYTWQISFLRRFDENRFLGWLKSDIVCDNGDINWPINLFSDLIDIHPEAHG